MFVAHLPAGYLLTRGLTRHRALRRWAWLGLLGSLLPDLDLLWFYFVDGRQHLHHSYWTHLPAGWLVIAAAWLLLSALSRSTRGLHAAAVLFPNVFLHLALDTLTGGIRWLHPWSRHGFSLFEVPARHGAWIANFVLHGTFLVEVAIVACALGVLLRARAAAPVADVQT